MNFNWSLVHKTVFKCPQASSAPSDPAPSLPSVTSVPLYHSKLKDQPSFNVQCFICVTHIWKIKGGLTGLLFSLTASASLWLVEMLKMDDSIDQTLLVIFWAHIGWAEADRNQIYMPLSFLFLKENRAPREQGFDATEFERTFFFLFSIAISWVSFGLSFICYLMSTTFPTKFLWFTVHYRF